MSQSSRAAGGDRPTLRLIKGDAGVAAELQRLEGDPTHAMRAATSSEEATVWRREAVVAYEVAQLARRHLADLPSDSEFAGSLADRADDYEAFARLRGIYDASDCEPPGGITRPNAAARAVADGYARALELADPGDERDWYLARLRDARTIAGMPTVLAATDCQGGGPS
jgi:hypothetical protein